MIPTPVYFRLKTLAMMNRKSVSHYLTLGAKHILAHHPDASGWPKEYWDDFRAIEAHSQRVVNRADGRLPALISKENSTPAGTNEASMPLARAKRTDKSHSGGG
jgi:hypothetical protein